MLTLRVDAFVCVCVCLKEMLEAYERHMSIMEEFDVFTPKHHQYIYMTFGIEYFGNPNFYIA